jgi:hypothetical protein
MNFIISIMLGIASGLGLAWFGTYILYQNQMPQLGTLGLVVRFFILLVSLVLLAFVLDWLLSHIATSTEVRSELGRAALLSFSAGIALRILLLRERRR